MYKKRRMCKRGCIIDDTDTEYMLKNLFLSDHETFMSDGKIKNKYDLRRIQARGKFQADYREDMQ